MPSMRDVRHAAEYGVLRMAFGLIRLLPLRTATALSARVWQTIGPRHRRHQRALNNLARAFPEVTAEERERIAREMWANMGRITAEALFLDRIVKEPDRFTVIGFDEFAPLMREPGPHVGVTLHMGNWELAIWPCTVSGGHPAGVYRPIDNPHVDRLLRKQRQPLYPAGMFGKGKRDGGEHLGQSTARRMIGHVRRGGRLAFVCDEVDRRGLPVPFFNHQARFTPVPAMIARHVGARLWMVRCLRDGKDSRFRVDVKELEVQRTDDREEDVRQTTAAIFRQFEAWIREAPEQWLWWNTRWVEDERQKA